MIIFERKDRVLFTLDDEKVEATIITTRQDPLPGSNLDNYYYVVVYNGQSYAATEDKLIPIFINEQVH